MEKKTISKKQTAYNRIKDMILNNQLRPGDSIVEREICESLDVSRTPVRAAFAELAEEGLVEIIPGRGVFVSRIRFEDMIEIYDIREALECMSVKLLTERITEPDLTALNKIVERMQRTSGSEFMALDMELHTTMARCSRNKRLAHEIDQIYSPIRLVANTAQNDPELRTNALSEHLDILAAISDRDSARAVEMMRRHILNVKEYHIKRYFLFTP
ncbi:MAG: GntR family transcriptional regulator [Oscillospiraceae bacterium]|nr:GntR family transcriptional regulator [Oscillospiraceae bacterium]